MSWSKYSGGIDRYGIWFRIFGYGLAIKNYNSSFVREMNVRHPLQRKIPFTNRQICILWRMK